MPSLTDDQLINLLKIKPTDKILDIGGSAKQHQTIKIDTLVDIIHPKKKTYNPSKLLAKKFVKVDITKNKLPFKDNQFDICLCTHTLEDLYNPFLVIDEISRVAKRGYISTPSRGTDSTFRHYDLTDWGVGAMRQPGLAHHYWFFEDKKGVMHITPKNYPILYAKEFQIKKWLGEEEFKYVWENKIKYKIFTSDSQHLLIENYREFNHKNQKYIQKGLVAIFIDNPYFIIKELIKRIIKRGNSFKYRSKRKYDKYL